MSSLDHPSHDAPDRRHPPAAPEDADLDPLGETEDDAVPMEPPSRPMLLDTAARDEDGPASAGAGGRSRRASVRRTSQSHRLMRTVLERLRDFDIDEVRALRDRNLPAAGRSGESARRSAAPPPPKPPET